MSRLSRTHAAHLYVAQAARLVRDLEQADAARYQTGAEHVDTHAPDLFTALCKAEGLPVPIREFEFHPIRKWRADYAFPAQRVLVEIDGGVWTQGRHTRGAGFIEDQRKTNAAQLLGF